MSRFSGRIVMIGFGTIARGTLPLLFSEFGITPDRLTIVSLPCDQGAIDSSSLAREVSFDDGGLYKSNYRQRLASLVQRGDIVLNLSVDVGSLDMAEACQKIGAHYLDTANEPWKDDLEPADWVSRTNYSRRLPIRDLKRAYPWGPTSLLTHGANPGLITSFTKQALLELAHLRGLGDEITGSVLNRNTPAAWAALARALRVKTVMISERDTQISAERRRFGEFVNTWSVEGFLYEALNQPAEVGWGTHEGALPADGVSHTSGSGAAIFLRSPAAQIRLRSWVPEYGPYVGFCIPHEEVISISEFLTVAEGTKILYRPTVCYSYHPCDDAVLSLHELIGKSQMLPDDERILMSDITSGSDELGVLLMTDNGGYWYGSNLSFTEANSIISTANATTLQVCAGVISGLKYIITHDRNLGILEPEQLEHIEILGSAEPFLGKLVGVPTSWTPLDKRDVAFEDVDTANRLAFSNFRL